MPLTKKKTYMVTYQYRYGDPKLSKVKANNLMEAKEIVERRRLGNYILAVEEFNPHKIYER